MLPSIRNALKDFLNMTEIATNEKEVEDRNRFRITDTLIELADDLVVRPLIIVSEDLKHQDNINDIINLNMDTFAASYTKAFEMTANIMGTRAEASLKLLSSRQVLPKDMGSFGIESLNNMMDMTVPCLDLDVEKQWDDKGSKRPIHIRELELTYAGNSIKGEGGKEEFEKGLRINVLVIADIIYVPNNELRLHLGTDGRDKLFFNRIDDVRAKLINFWKDMVFVDDMSREYKASRLRSKTELSKFITERQVTASIKRVRGTGGMGEYYSMLILSRTATLELELILGATFNKDRMRNMVYESFKAMSLTRVDVDHDMIIFDLKSQSQISSATMNFKSIKKKSDNDELLDILKFQAGMR